MRGNERLEEFKRLYSEENLTLKEIAERFGVSKQAVHERLARAGVRMRNRGYVPRPTPTERLKETIDVAPLVRRYEVDLVSIHKLADEFGISAYAVGRILVSEGVEICPRGPRPRRKGR